MLQQKYLVGNKRGAARMVLFLAALFTVAIAVCLLMAAMNLWLCLPGKITTSADTLMYSRKKQLKGARE